MEQGQRLSVVVTYTNLALRTFGCTKTIVRLRGRDRSPAQGSSSSKTRGGVDRLRASS